jgi:hypothetical protein
MSRGKFRRIGPGTAAGVVGLHVLAFPALAYADDIGLVLGGSGTPIPGAEYVETANNLYLEQVYGDGITYYQATADNPYGDGLYTPEGFYPGTGIHTLPIVYPVDANGMPTESTSVGQGINIVVNTIESDIANGDTDTMFGYSQSSVIAGYVMQELQADGVAQNDVNFLLVGDPANPNGGLFERFAGFETLSGQTVSQPFALPSLGLEFGGSTPADDYVTNIYTLEYDGYADFPRYPLNFLSDLNAFIGGEAIHGSYLDGDPDIAGPTAADIAGATLLPGSALDGATDSLTNYYMIDETPPLVALLPQPLQALLGPDLTYLINLGYGDGSEGYSVTADAPANIATPFGLFPDVSLSQVFSTLTTDTQQGITAFEAYLTDPTTVDPASTGQSFAELMTALQADAADPTATITELANAISTASSAAYSTLLPTADILNALVTSVPAYDLSLFSENIANGDLLDAIGLPMAADTALVTLAAGFELEVIQSAATQISDAFSGLF